MALIETPLTIENLDDSRVCFCGSAQETEEIPSLMGTREVTTKYPFLAISRENWEGLGMPTRLLMVIERGYGEDTAGA